MKKQEGGFTIPELLVALILSALFVGLILFFTISYWRYGYLLEADLDTLITRLNAGDFLRNSIGQSSGIIIQNSIPDSHTNNPDPAISSGLYWIPLHAVPGTTLVGTSGTKPLLYYKGFSFNAAGNYIMNGTQPYEDEFIIYLDGTTKTIMLRSLANPNAPGNRLKTSCPPAIATSSCPADKVIASDLASVERRYFSRTGNLINYLYITEGVCEGGQEGQYNGSYDGCIGPDFPAVEVVELTLNLSKKPIFQKTYATSNSTIIRIALRNK